SDPSDLEFLRGGRVRVRHYDPVDVSAFDWTSTSSTDYTWFMQMQEMRFLLPLIASRRESDHALAKDWLARWFAVHMVGDMPRRRWGEPMTWAYRAMVFVYYLKTEMLRATPDADVVGMLAGSILEHQQFLSQDGNFDVASNHGLIDALGLLETTRVFANPAAIQLADEHMREIVGKSVSARGVHMEHAAGYHFAFLRWLDEIVEYIADVPGVSDVTAREIGAAAAAMHDAAYYLQDHAGNVAQVGDTDSTSAAEYAPEYRAARSRGRAEALYDPESGYAIFKERGGSPLRYVVFRQPSVPSPMIFHRHHDALSVIVDLDGETLLGDGGRFEYRKSARRGYFEGFRAHNTIVPAGALQDAMPSRTFEHVSRCADLSSPDGVAWSADLSLGSLAIRRTVRMPASSSAVVVADSIRQGARGRLSPGSEVAVVLWNLGRDVTELRPELNGENGTWSWTITTRRHRRVRLLLTPGDVASVVSVRVARGEFNPMLAWYSPSQSNMRPIPAIITTLRVGEGATLETRVETVRRGIRR
ncbi:MAG TPA: heparinase II/III family protein, partial [Candidatus Krumholzibacteria bacterium]|nr:heparinase II/III family protein [Candidatus Krumholzibacteria bacterium]